MKKSMFSISNISQKIRFVNILSKKYDKIEFIENEKGKRKLPFEFVASKSNINSYYIYRDLNRTSYVR